MTLDLLSICNDKNIEEQLEDSKTNKSSIYKMISDTLKTIGDEKKQRPMQDTNTHSKKKFLRQQEKVEH